MTYTHDRRNRHQTVLEGTFKGRFESTSINEVQGKCTFFDSNQTTLVRQIRSLATSSGTSIVASLTINNERIYGLNYIDECKTFHLLTNTPPFLGCY